MLKIKVEGAEKVSALDYNSIPVGSVFTHVENLDTVPEHGIVYLKCEDGNAVMLNFNVGQIVDRDDFVLDKKFWVVLDSTLVIQR